MGGFFKDLFKGDFADIYQGIKSNPWKSAAEAAAAVAAVAAPWALPEIAPAIGLGTIGATEAGVGAGAGLAGAGEAAAAGLPLDILAGGPAAGTAGLETLGSLAPAAGSAGAGLAPELTSAGLSGWPGLVPGVTSAGLGAFSPSSALSFAPSGASPTSAAGIGSDFASASPSAGIPSIITTGTSGGGAGVLDSLAATGSLSGDTLPLDLSAPAKGAASSVAADSPGFGSSALGWIKSNPGLAAALGLGAAGTLFGGRLGSKLAPPLPNQPQLTAEAQQAGAQAEKLSAEGQDLLGPIRGGPLPPALEAQVTNALGDAIATTKSRYAQLGLSGSTMESDQISYLQQQAEAQRGTLALQLAQAGTNLISQSTVDLGLESNIYQGLMQNQIQQDTGLEQSIAQFAGAAAGALAISGQPRVTIQTQKAA